MKILFVSAVMPYPLYSGGQIRIYNLLKQASGHHEITLCAFTRSPSEKQQTKELSFCKKLLTVLRGNAWQPGYVLGSIFGKYPLVFSTYNLAKMRDTIQRELSEGSYDLIHIEPGYVFPALPKTTIPLVVGEHNIEHAVYEGYIRRFPIVPIRPLLFADVIKLRIWERTVWKHAAHIAAVSKHDASAIAEVVGGENVTVVPNGVDIGEFPYKPKKTVSADAPTFLFVGNFSWMQNRDAAEVLVAKAWMRIHSKYPKAILRIVGKNMTASLKQKVLKEGVELHEHVEDIREEYRGCDALLAPIRIGGGTKFKILEAMASGLPVITTSKGIEGLTVENGKHVMVVDDIADMVGAVDMLLNEKFRKPMTLAAREKIEEDYSWKTITGQLLTVWMKAYEKSH